MATDSDNPKSSKKTTASTADEHREDESPVVFEEALEELENLVVRMEAGDLSLNDSLKAFERGVTLTSLQEVG